MRVLKNVFNDDKVNNTELTSITHMEFDEDHRKLIIGSTHGQVKVFDLLSGIETHKLEPHHNDAAISFIGYGGHDFTIITAGWDRTLKVHMDERLEHKSPAEMVKRGKLDCHTRDLICGDYSHNLGLIATGGRDNRVKIWDYERVIICDEIKAHDTEVSLVKFLNPLPLLLSSDISGQLYIWLVKPHAMAGQCVVSWRNQ